MPTALFSRRYVTVLSHVLGWGLVGYLLFFAQPFGGDVKLPALFWVRQVIFFFLLIGAFYLNLLVLMPRLLQHAKTNTYLLAVAGLIIAVLLIVGGIEFSFDLANLMHRAFRPGGGGRVRYFGWLFPNFFAVLLILCISTSIGLLQKWQQDAALRLALEQAKTTSELSFLKAQINPHFFFNTLNNIYALTLIDGDTAREALHRLSRMMRYVLYETQTGYTLLSKEMAFLNDYIQLMQLRLTDKVTVSFETPTELRDISIAPMLFLPFVENAFKHGVSTTQTSRIRIALAQTPDKLRFDVSNTLLTDKPPSLEAANGIGLVNTRRRLDLLYPGQYTLQIDEQNPNHEYHVHLTLHLP